MSESREKFECRYCGRVRHPGDPYAAQCPNSAGVCEPLIADDEPADLAALRKEISEFVDALCYDKPGDTCSVAANLKYFAKNERDPIDRNVLKGMEKVVRDGANLLRRCLAVLEGQEG